MCIKMFLKTCPIFAIYPCNQTTNSQQCKHHMADLPSLSQQLQMFHPDFECVFIIIFSAHVLLITRLLYDSKMLPGQRAGLQSGCKSKKGMLTNLIIFEECTSKTLLIFRLV